MSNWTPQDWAMFLTALAAFCTGVVIPILQILTNRKVTKLDEKVEASAAVSDANSTSLQVLKHQTNDMSVRLQAASMAAGTAQGHEAGRIEGRDEERANPSG